MPNDGGSDLIINAVEFRVLESLSKMPLGQASCSAVYDLDISALAEYCSIAECQVAQTLKPGEADRFAIVRSAPSLGMFGGWRLATLFKSNVGSTTGPDIEVWLPGGNGESQPPFASLIQQIALKTEQCINTGAGVVAESEPGTSAGYKTFIVVNTSILWYYGPQPLITTPGTIPSSEFWPWGSTT